MTIRAATDADLPGITAILEANDEPVTWPGVPRPPYVEHLADATRDCGSSSASSTGRSPALRARSSSAIRGGAS